MMQMCFFLSSSSWDLPSHRSVITRTAFPNHQRASSLIKRCGIICSNHGRHKSNIPNKNISLQILFADLLTSSAGTGLSTHNAPGHKPSAIDQNLSPMRVNGSRNARNPRQSRVVYANVLFHFFLCIQHRPSG